MHTKKVKLLNLENDEEISAILEYTTTHSQTKIILTFNDTKISAENYDLLDTLIDIRKQLNERNLDILVNGSRKDISSSSRIKKAYSGEKTYRVRQGIGAGYEDIINILDPIKKEKLSTLEEQRKYHTIWIDSLAPTKGEREEAKKHPNGWIYRFDTAFSEDEAVPPEAIVGAWKVDEKGDLTGEWKDNKNFIPKELRDKK